MNNRILQTITNPYLEASSLLGMASIKSIGKVFALIISGIAIVVVGGFMMGAVARLWLPKDKKDKQKSIHDSDDKKTD